MKADRMRNGKPESDSLCITFFPPNYQANSNPRDGYETCLQKEGPASSRADWLPRLFLPVASSSGLRHGERAGQRPLPNLLVFAGAGEFAQA